MTLLNGYEMISTFPMDFTIADKFGTDAIQDTFNRAFNEWKSNYKYLTELVVTLNLKLWEHYEKNGDCPIARLYNTLWMQARDYAYDNLEGEELSYYFNVVD